MNSLNIFPPQLNKKVIDALDKVGIKIRKLEVDGNCIYGVESKGEFKHPKIFDYTYVHLTSDEGVTKIKELLNRYKSYEIRISSFFNNPEPFLYSGMNLKIDRWHILIDTSDIEKLWLKIHKHRRNEVRYAIKKGISIEKVSADRLTYFYKMYTEVVRKHGGIPVPLEVVRSLIDLSDVSFIEADYKGRPLGFSIVLLGSKIAVLLFSVSSSLGNRFKVSSLLYWHSMKICNEKEIDFLDIGQVGTGDSIYKYKVKWNGTIYPIITIHNTKNKRKEIIKRILRRLYLPMKLYSFLWWRI